jgi:cell division protein FtsB
MSSRLDLYSPTKSGTYVCTRDQKGVFSHDQAVKKDADTGLGGLIPQLRGRAVQYLLVFLGSVLVIDALVGDKGVLQMLKKRQELRTLDQAVAAARVQNAEMRAEIDRINTDPAALEEMARKDLGLIKPGEKLFIIRDAPPVDKRPGDK